MRAWRTMGTAWRPVQRRGDGPSRGQALAEFCLLLVVLALPTFIALTGYQVLNAKLQVGPVAREAARAMAEAPSAGTAVAIGQARAFQVAGQMGLRPERLMITVDPGTFARESGIVSVTVRYRVDLRGMALLGLPDPVVARTARWPVQRFQDR